MYIWRSKYFCGNKVSEYGLQHNRVDYRTLAQAFDAVLCNEIIPATAYKVGEWECVNGSECWYYDEDGNEISRDEYDENGGDEECRDFYQYYIISPGGYNILSSYTDETVWYNDELDMYVWGVTHFGTSWDYVLTDIRIDLDSKQED